MNIQIMKDYIAILANMKLINQSFEFINQESFDIISIKKFIEKCTRISYKSENRITDNSYEKFVNMLINSKHYAGLEFGTIHLKMNLSEFDNMRRILSISRLYNNKWLQYHYVGDIAYITTNYRYYIESLQSYEEFITDEDNEYYPKRYTTKIITNRSVSHELVRHRVFSFIQESQRYCNYSKDKFNNSVTYIIPAWLNIPENNYINLDGDWCDANKTKIQIDKNNNSINNLLWALNSSEQFYILLLNTGWKPQQARTVLPNATKTEVCMCGFANAWEHFFELRDVETVDPQMYALAKPMHQEFLKLCK